MRLRHAAVRQLGYSLISTAVLALIIVLCRELKRRRRLKDRRRLLVVLDFDETITKRHVGMTPSEELTEPEIRTNIRDRKFLVEFLVLAKEMGHFCAVASFSDEKASTLGVAGSSLIKSYLQAIFKPLDFSDYISPNLIESWNPEYRSLNQSNPSAPVLMGKAAHISNIIKKI
eukprot:TRINITY_DN13426_c3_g1_i1.p1 TRINITY_DN13426_c3_g1~~TRINITY_DN13426_c3_g1_i1.p1  ORF type:complete len:173 (+),score=8.48 TRINITY_DN13426_c3_g1_i1:57-575(+)